MFSMLVQQLSFNIPAQSFGIHTLTKLQITKQLLGFQNSLQFIRGKKVSVEEELELPNFPNAPIKPMAKLRLQYSHLSYTDIQKKFKDLEPNALKKLQEEYKKELSAFKSEKKAYMKDMSEEDLNNLKTLKLRRKKVAAEQKQKKNDNETLGKPKRFTSILIYVENVKIPGKHLIEYIKEYQNLPESEKEIYISESKVRHLQYVDELNKWEIEMFKLGRYELIRKDALRSLRNAQKKKTA